MTDSRTLFAIDVDGTLLGYDGSIAPEVIAVVQRAVAAGHEIVISTGRSLMGTMPVVQKLGLTSGYVVTSNGAVIAAFDANHDTRVLASWEFDATDAAEALAEVDGQPSIAAELPDGSYKVCGDFPTDQLFADEIEQVSADELTSDPVTRVSVCGGPEDMAAMHEVAASLGMADVTVALGYTAWLDVSPPGVTKASGLTWLVPQLPNPVTRTVAIGDGDNDTEMLDWADRGYVMGQAADDVKKHADVVVADVAHHGVVDAMERELDNKG